MGSAPAPDPPRVQCVLLPCSSGETWAVPVNSLAEVVASGELLAGRLCWRGRELPVYPAATGAGGMYAVMLGLRDLPGDHWALSLHNRPLQYRLLDEAELAGQEAGIGDTLAVFAVAGTECVIPDLAALQQRLAAESADPGS